VFDGFFFAKSVASRVLCPSYIERTVNGNSIFPQNIMRNFEKAAWNPPHQRMTIARSSALAIFQLLDFFLEDFFIIACLFT
jgi:hypothetical protein